MTDRMIFIPELKEKITKGLVEQGVPDKIISYSFKLWEGGEEPLTPWERGCFSVFKTVQDQVNNV